MKYALTVIVEILGSTAVLIGAVYLVRHNDQTRIAAIRKVALFMMLGFAVLAGLFIAGETMSDPGGTRGMLLITLWLVPLLILSYLSWQLPKIAFPILLLAVLVVVILSVWEAIDPDAWQKFTNNNGPVVAITSFVVGAALSIYVYFRTTFVGSWLLIFTSLIPIFTSLVTSSGGRLLSPSSTQAANIPACVAGIMYLWCSVLEDSRTSHQSPVSIRSVEAS